MNMLKKIPFWGWFILVTLVCYAVWNPTGYSVYDLWVASPLEEQIFLKLTISFVLALIIFFFLVTTLQTIGKLGVFLYLVFLVLIFGLLYELGIIDFSNLSSARYWGQPLVALLLTIGLLFNKMRFAITGIRSVDDSDLDE